MKTVKIFKKSEINRQNLIYFPSISVAKIPLKIYLHKKVKQHDIYRNEPNFVYCK